MPLKSRKYYSFKLDFTLSPSFFLLGKLSKFKFHFGSSTCNLPAHQFHYFTTPVRLHECLTAFTRSPARGADPPLGSDSARGLSSSAFTLPQLADQTRLAFSSRRSNLADTHNAPRVLQGKLFHLSCLSTCLTFCFTFGNIPTYQQLSTTYQQNTKF